MTTTLVLWIIMQLVTRTLHYQFFNANVLVNDYDIAGVYANVVKTH